MEIVALIRNRDEKGLSLLYDRYAPTLLGIIVRIVKNQNIGEEILQQTLLKAWNNIHQFKDDKGTFFTWLASIARNAAIDQARLKGFQNRNATEALDDNHYQISTSVLQSDKLDVSRLLGRLDQSQKMVLDLVYLQGYSHRDAAEYLEIPLGTVKSRLRLAIKYLREELKGEEKLFLGAMILLLIISLVI